jgi:2-polyprenyl-6-methoxyphenol hydroxylase-like FAD-dependent oxidoreductase
MSKMPRLKIITTGGSLAGLLVSHVLQTLGHDLTILERSPSTLLHSQGAGIVAGGPVQEYFSRFDRTYTPFTVKSQARQYLNKAGEVIDYEERTQEMTSWDLLFNVLRANFDAQGDPSYHYGTSTRFPQHGHKGRYLHGCKVTGLEDLGGKGVKVLYVDVEGSEKELVGDFVLAADGASSTIRDLLSPGVHRTYTGYVAWRGTVREDQLSDETRERLGEKFTFFHANGTQVLA